MDYGSLSGRTVYDLEGQGYRIVKKVAESEHWAKYESADGFIIKIVYAKESKREELVKKYEWLMDIISSKNIKAMMPVAILEKPYMGYIMLKADGYKPLDKYIAFSGTSFQERYNYETGGLRRRLEIGEVLARVLKNLHMVGLTYFDLCPSNVLVAEKYNSIVLADPDSLIPTGAFKASMLGASKYVAPELFKGTIQPNSLSDTYSYAVILFEMLMLKDPFVGGNVLDGMLITSELREIFRRMFVDGLYDCLKRPTLDEFIYACQKATDSLIRCSGPLCNAWFYYDEDGKNVCPLCQREQDDIIKLTFYKYIRPKNLKMSNMPQKVGQLILNQGEQLISKRHFEPSIPIEKDKWVIMVRTDENKRVRIRKLIDAPIYLYDKEKNLRKPLGQGVDVLLIRGKNAVVYEKNFNIAEDKPLDMREIIEIYGDVAIENYAVLY